MKMNLFSIIAYVILAAMLLVGIYGVYDCLTDSGIWAGIHGMLCLIIGEPVLALLLVIDGVVWYFYKKIKGGNKT